MSAVHVRQHSIAAGTEETIIENGSMERLQALSMSSSPANGREPVPVMSNGTTR